MADLVPASEAGKFPVLVESGWVGARSLKCISLCAGNCRLLEMNTMTFPNVHVECSGLWDKDASLGMVTPYVRLSYKADGSTNWRRKGRLVIACS